MKYKNLYSLQYTVIMVVLSYTEPTGAAIHGRYTRDILDYQLTLPHRVSQNGDFVSFDIPKFFKHIFKRTKRGIHNEKVYYNVIFNGKDHHIELWPNHDFVSPNLVTEIYRSSRPVSDRKLKRMTGELCHYVGHIRGEKTHTAALSLCNGMAGYLMTDKGQYFIEPLAEHQANAFGEHVHVIYKRNVENVHNAHENPERHFTPPHCGMKEKWTDAWERRLKDEAKKQRRDEAGGAHSKHRYLELLAVVDHKFIDYHKNDNMENYILTIMNMVYNYYHDVSAGHQIDVHVVRIIYLEKQDKHLDLEISKNAEVTLDSFCAWSKTVNPKEVSNPQHHDISVLLTRYDLCSDNVTDCNLMGLAFLAAACDPDKACAINEDSGLALGITVTHEVGHVMGCAHDNGEDSPCKPQNDAGEYYIMSPYVHMQTTQWSPCSKKFMTELFEYASMMLQIRPNTCNNHPFIVRNKMGECLNDAPQESLYKETDMPPGSVYDADYQCNVAFPGSTHCVIEESKVCEMLYCKMPGGTSCNSKGQPPADGTKCGEKMWCYNTKCVEIGQRPAAVDGGWGNWNSWSECSRTCGGGISYSERECNNPTPANKGLYCLGEVKRVKMCNTNECPPGSVPYRDQQCADYDSKPFKGSLSKWKPFFQRDNPCQLTCINEDHVFVQLAPRVKDGTSCKPGTKNKCIFGKCRKVGCDWVIDSDAIEDMCGVCNGDGSQCKIVDKVFTAVGNGYVKVETIPAGSRNIEVHENAASENTIAISAEDGTHFFLNGDFKEEINGDKNFAGVHGVYDHPAEDKETLFIGGPLTQPLVLQVVFYTQKNPGVAYKYAAPLPLGEKREPEKNPVYNWEFLEFGECSTRCGPGTKTAVAECVEKTAGKVGDTFCKEHRRPPSKTIDCNVRQCKTEWHARSFGPCSGCKGKTGTRTRIIDCVEEAREAGKEPMIVEDSKCTGTKPDSSEVCCSDEPCKTVRSTNVGSTDTKSTDSRSTDDVEKRIGDLWFQIEDIKKRKQMQNERSKITFTENELKNAGKPGKKFPKRYIVEPEVHITKYNNKLNNKFMKKFRLKKREDANCNETTTFKTICEKEGEKFVSDHIPPEGQKLIEVPIKENHEDVKLSDAAFESEGDKVVDTLDFCNAKIFSGDKADAELKKLKKEIKT